MSDTADPTNSNPREGLEHIVSGIKNTTGSILRGLNTFIGKPAGKLIVFFIFIIILIFAIVGGLGFLTKSAKKKKQNRKNSAYKNKDKGKDNQSIYDKVINTLTSISSPLGTKAYSSVPRDIDTIGRCDNIKWLTIKNKITGAGICVDTTFKQPPPVTFTIDPTNLHEYEKMPNQMKQKIRKNASKLSITVPYMYNEIPSSYVLDFSKATYADGTSAKHLFNERFTYDYWNFSPKSLNSTPSNKRYRYTDRKRPLKNNSAYKGLAGYV